MLNLPENVHSTAYLFSKNWEEKEGAFGKNWREREILFTFGLLATIEAGKFGLDVSIGERERVREVGRKSQYQIGTIVENGGGGREGREES